MLRCQSRKETSSLRIWSRSPVLPPAPKSSCSASSRTSPSSVRPGPPIKMADMLRWLNLEVSSVMNVSPRQPTNFTFAFRHSRPAGPGAPPGVIRLMYSSAPSI